MKIQRIAILSVHTSPLAPMGGKKTGGMNVYIRELAQELGRQGIVVDIFTRRSSEHEPDIDYSIGENVQVVYLNAGPISALPPDEQYEHLSEFTANLIAFATRFNIRYDIAYSHYWLSGWVAAKLKEAWGLPFVQMFHTLGHMKQRIMTNNLHTPNTRINIETHVMHWADKIIAATPAEHSQLIWLYRADRRKIEIIPPGVNTSHFQQTIPAEQAREQLGLACDCNMLLFVGRIEPLKAIDTILEALFVIKEQDPKILKHLCFTIVGGEPDNPCDEEMQRLQALSRKLSIDHIVNFVGAQEQAHLPLFYSAATAVVMPSDYESFGMVALEAMATGTPVIASQVGGLAFLVRDQETGFLIPVREPSSLAECIIALLHDPQKAKNMGESASRLAQEYAWTTISKRLLHVFEQVLTGKLNAEVG